MPIAFGHPKGCYRVYLLPGPRTSEELSHKGEAKWLPPALGKLRLARSESSSRPSMGARSSMGIAKSSAYRNKVDMPGSML